MNASEHLDRLIRLHHYLESTDYSNKEICEEYRYHQHEVVKEYLPLLDAMARAGILTVWIPDKHLRQQRPILSVFENGGFQLDAEDWTEFGETKLHQTN